MFNVKRFVFFYFLAGGVGSIPLELVACLMDTSLCSTCTLNWLQQVSRAVNRDGDPASSSAYITMNGTKCKSVPADDKYTLRDHRYACRS